MTSRKIKVTEKSSVKQPRHELLQVAEVVAREKNIEKDEVLFAMECAIQKAAKAKYGYDHNIRVTIDKTTGEIGLQRVVTVVETVENEMSEISLSAAKDFRQDAELGFEFTEELPPFDFGRGAVQGSRQVIQQKIREVEREHLYTEFISRKGEIVNGIVKNVDYNQVIIDVGRTEGVLKKGDNIPRQIFRLGDRVKAILIDIKPDASGPMLILSRTHNDFIKKLFEQEVTEVYDGMVKVMSVARDAGSRSKVAVYSADNRLDPVGACVGVKGSRVQAVMAELYGEKVDVLAWSPDPATYVMNALSLPEIKRVVIDEEKEVIQVIVAEELLSQAIGRRGQNVRLASLLTKWKITVISDEEDTARRNIEKATKVKALVNDLCIDDIMAQLLISEGFSSIDDIAQSELDEFLDIEGFDENIAKELRERAIAFVGAQESLLFEKCKELEVQDDLLTLPDVDVSMFLKLLDAGIRNKDDVGDLSRDELIDIIGKDLLTELLADSIILAARESWFESNENVQN